MRFGKNPNHYMCHYEKFRLFRRSKVEFKGPFIHEVSNILVILKPLLRLSAKYVHAGKIKTCVSFRTPLYFWPNMWLVPKTKLTNNLTVLLNVLTTKYNFHWQVDLIEFLPLRHLFAEFSLQNISTTNSFHHFGLTSFTLRWWHHL